MRSYIKLSPELRAATCAEFGVTRQTVWEACAYLRDTQRSKDIRAYVLAHGGQRVTEYNYVPACKVAHNSDGSWLQDFGNGVVVLLQGGAATIRKDDKDVDSYEGITLENWGNVLLQAQALSQGRHESLVNG
jgi:hypothetical protein